MKDVQNEKDIREVELEYVGIKGVNIPIKLRDKNKDVQQVQAVVEAFVNLDGVQKGIHMSHIIDTLFKLREEYGLDQLVKVAEEIRDKQTKENNGMKTKSSNLILDFKYFVDKEAPVSKVSSVLAYDVRINIDVGRMNTKKTMVTVPVSTCCPCSLELCDNKAAHNQRGYIKITAIQDNDDDEIVWFEDLIKIAEESGSCEIYPVLRRPDEKYVTNKMFEHAKFVEDCVRDAVIKLKVKYPKLHFIVSCENMESIHDHSAYAKTYI